MQTNDIILRPAMVFAFFKAVPLMLFATLFLVLAWQLSPFFLFFSFALTGMAWYRFLYIRNCLYTVTPEVVRISRGIFFKRVDQVELYRMKDYIVTQPLYAANF